MAFEADLTRGYWAVPSDFIYAAIGLAFRFDVFTQTWWSYMPINVLSIVPYMLSLVIYVVPIMLIQSFMGQFSRSGFISAFRLSPLCKGLGYISLVLNIGLLTYSSIFVAVPLLFLLAVSPLEYFTRCRRKKYRISQFKDMHDMTDVQNNNFLSWELLFCTTLTWFIIAHILVTFFAAEKLGKLLRYALWTTLALLLICLIRFSILPGIWHKLDWYQVANMDYEYLPFSLQNALLTAVSVCGPGWGSVIALASFNGFKANIAQYSWITCFGQLFVFIALGALTRIVEIYFNVLTPASAYDTKPFTFILHCFTLYLGGANAIATMEVPILWSIIFFGMLTLGSLMAIVTQLHAIFTSLFDEFPTLRERKNNVIFSLIGFLYFSSFYTCNSKGFSHYIAIAWNSIFMQSLLNFLLLIVICWLYGKQRFQRDLEFMLSQNYRTWRIYLFMLRFIAPLFLLLTLSLSLFGIYYSYNIHNSIALLINGLFFHIPWVLILSYIFFVLVNIPGRLALNFKRCLQPADWHPVETDEHLKYMKAMADTTLIAVLETMASKTRNGPLSVNLQAKDCQLSQIKADTRTPTSLVKPLKEVEAE